MQQYHLIAGQMMKTYIVDSFTDQPFKGNPAGVCLPEGETDSTLMLAIAKELGLSETAFVSRLEEDNRFSIRYFSPKMEIPLCGHATLASAKVIFERLPLDDIHFITIQNLDLWIRKSGSDLLMEFPVYETEPAAAPKALLAALGIEEITNSVYNRETNILLLEISDAGLLRNLNPDFEALSRSHTSINGVLVTAPATDAEFDFHSRYFWPWSGTNEDPVTGGTHTFLTKYWSKKLRKTRMRSFQSSARTGSMEVELVDDAKLTIKGQAVIVFEGNLKI